MFHAVMLMIGLLPWAGSAARDQCGTVRYVEGQFDVGDADSRVITVAIDPSEFSRRTLRCLVQQLSAAYPRPSRFYADVFDSAHAVKAYAGAPGERSRRDIVGMSHNLASYARESAGERLELHPFGEVARQALESTVDLKSDSPGDCAVAIVGRCLIAAALPRTQMLQRLQVAMVRLRGRLAADGRVGGLGLASGEWTPQQKEFARLAIEHLKSWRLEPNGSGETPLDISIDLVDESRSAPIQVRVGSSGEGVTALHVAFSRTDAWALPSR